MTRTTLSFRFVLGVVILLVVAAGCGDDETPVDTGDGAGSAGVVPEGEYRSVEVMDGGAPRPLVEGTTIALRFGDGTIGASAGCNQLGGSYTLTDGVLEVDGLSMTEMGCDPPRHQQDEWLADLLVSRSTLAVSDDGFTLTSADGTTSIRFVERSVVEPDVALVGTEWEVTGFIDGEAAMSASIEEPGMLQFAEEGFVAGFDGCNGIGFDPSGDGLRYDVDGDTITFGGNAISTLVACEGSEDYQQRYRAILAGEVTWEVAGPNLTLIAPDGRGVTYRAVGDEG